jgi:hypothetical protein
LRPAGYSRGNTWSRKNGRFFDYQFGVLYGGQQESDTKHVKFYSHMLIAAFRGKLQRSPRTLQDHVGNIHYALPIQGWMLAHLRVEDTDLDQPGEKAGLGHEEGGATCKRRDDGLQTAYQSSIP